MDYLAIINEALEQKGTSVDGHHGRAIVEKLESLGYQGVNWPSKCGAATYERHYRKDGTVIEVIESNFLGRFTQLSVFSGK